MKKVLFLILLLSLLAQAVEAEKELDEGTKALISAVETFQDSIDEEMKALSEKMDTALNEAEKCYEVCSKGCEGITAALDYVDCIYECGRACFREYDTLNRRWEELAEVWLLQSDIIEMLRYDMHILTDADRSYRSTLPDAFTEEVAVGEVFVSGRGEVGAVVFNVGEEKIKQGDGIIVPPGSLFKGDVESSSLKVNGGGTGAHVTIPKEGGAFLKIDLGALWMKLRPSSKKYEIELCGGCGVLGVRGTSFFIDIDNNGTTILGVLEGDVEVRENGNKSTIIGEGQTILITPGIGPSEPEKISFPIKEWWKEQPESKGRSWIWVIILAVIIIAAGAGIRYLQKKQEKRKD